MTDAYYAVECREECGFEDECPSVSATPMACPECGAGISAEVVRG